MGTLEIGLIWSIRLRRFGQKYRLINPNNISLGVFSLFYSNSTFLEESNSFRNFSFETTISDNDLG